MLEVHNGGYVLSKKPNEIKLTDIFHAVDEKLKLFNVKKIQKKDVTVKPAKCINS